MEAAACSRSRLLGDISPRWSHANLIVVAERYSRKCIAARISSGDGQHSFPLLRTPLEARRECGAALRQPRPRCSSSDLH